jgi:hypothetical protein
LALNFSVRVSVCERDRVRESGRARQRDQQVQREKIEREV